MPHNSALLEGLHLVNGLAPVADAGNGTVTTDVVNMENAGRAVFILTKGVGATGTSTITMLACDDVTPSNTTAIPFQYRDISGGNDTTTALTEATTAGFTTTAGNNTIVACEVVASDLAATGYGYLQMKAVEVVDSPVLFGVTVLLGDLRSTDSTGDTAIV